MNTKMTGTTLPPLSSEAAAGLPLDYFAWADWARLRADYIQVTCLGSVLSRAALLSL